MSPYRFLDTKVADILLVSLSLTTAVLISCYVFFLISFDPGFIYENLQGEIRSVAADSPLASKLREGDKLVQIGDVDVRKALASRTGDILRDLRNGKPTTLQVEREGQLLTFVVQVPHKMFLRPAHLALCFSGPLFWLMGTTAGIFLRPRDDRWLILILCFYTTSLWLATGSVSVLQSAYARVIFRFLIWIFMPLAIHLHLILPNALFRRYHKFLLPPLYVGALVGAIFDFLQRLDEHSFYWSPLLVATCSAVILAIRLVRPASPAIKVANRLMLFGVVLGFGPIFLYSISIQVLPYALFIESYEVWGTTLFILFTPLWPLAYIYAIYKHDVGTLKYRANRFLGTYGFLSIFLTVYVLVFAALARTDVFSEDSLILTLSVSLVFVAIGPYLRAKFQSITDRHVFGIRYVPDEVMSAFAERIPAAYDRSALSRVVVEEILPTLLVRQSALYYFGDLELETIFEQDVTVRPREDGAMVLRDFLAFNGRYLPLDEVIHPDYPWVRLVVPLVFQDETVGIWLFGQRDPDDYYPQNDIELLTNLANQIAPVIENVRLVEIARHELEENKRLQQQLLHSQKMEAIGSLSAGIAHDFNNLLSVVLGNSYLLLDDYVDEEGEVGRFLGEIRDAGERAAGLTRQLLTFSRQSEMEVRIVSLSDVVKEMAQMLRLLAGKEVDLELHLGKDLPPVRVDPGQIGQVIVNLVVNARDAMPEGGTLTIETSKIEHTRSGIFAQVDMEPGPYLWLQVADTGTGLDPDIRSRIFEPFFTTKEAGKGTGLGLSMVYGIVNQSHGHVFVESESGEGTSFHIFLPAVTGEEQALEDARSPAEREAFAGEETVLVVEDERGVREVTCMILRSRGYRILEAAGGEEGLKISAAYDGRIDLLLTDVVMPKMQGPALARELAQSRPELKVLFMSGYHDDSHFARHAGASQPDVLQKPFSPQELCRRVRESLDAELAVASPGGRHGL